MMAAPGETGGEDRLLQSALTLARRNLKVFPLYGAIPLPDGRMVCSCGTLRCRNPAKHPMPRLVPSGFKNGSSSGDQIRHWWSVSPGANVGLVTGSVIVLDVDPRHGGAETLSRLERRHGALPATWQALTGGGGHHIYFGAPNFEIRNSAGRLGSGLDIRGAGGYVVAPPSLHISGRQYAWVSGRHPDEVQLAPLPEWIGRALLRPQGSRAAAAEWRHLVQNEVEAGCRNDTIARLGGHLLRRYVDPEVAHQLLQAWNAARCRPPLSAEEVTRTLGSIARRELRRREARYG